MYNELVKKIANDKRTSFERGDILVREMCQLIDKIMNYRYTAEHYDGTGNALEDMRNRIKKDLTLVKTDLDIYMEQLGVTEDVEDKATKRLEKLVKRM